MELMTKKKEKTERMMIKDDFFLFPFIEHANALRCVWEGLIKICF